MLIKNILHSLHLPSAIQNHAAAVKLEGTFLQSDNSHDMHHDVHHDSQRLLKQKYKKVIKFLCSNRE